MVFQVFLQLFLRFKISYANFAYEVCLYLVHPFDVHSKFILPVVAIAAVVTIKAKTFMNLSNVAAEIMRRLEANFTLGTLVLSFRFVRGLVLVQ
uniref:Putative secreted peptide n=1 Tax=Anopheles braziliensis TaxID=58242 RepID=A0A2M3ZWJ6_9DIPT